MLIIQEKPSNNGCLRVMKIRNVQETKMVDNYYLGDKIQPVIECRTAIGKYYIGYFPNIELRNNAYTKIINSTTITVVLDYNTYFTNPLDLDLSTILKKYNLSTSLLWALRRTGKPEETWHTLDAMRALDTDTFNAIKAGIPTPIKELNLANLWSKTFMIKTNILLQGITKKQFFQHLIIKNNEKFNIHSIIT